MKVLPQLSTEAQIDNLQGSAVLVERLISGIFAVCLIWASVMATVGWNHGLSDNGGFRQTQTAITSYYLAQGGSFKQYETPVLGAPWSIPLEFPLYQWIVARTATTLDTPLDQTGRFVSELFFAFSLLLLWPILSEFRIRPAYRLIFLSLILVSPEYIFWSRTFMIESMAVFFCLGYFLFILRYIRTRRVIDAAFGSVFGALGVLVKLTTFPAFACIGCGLYIFNSRHDLKRLRSREVLLRHAFAFITFACVPILTGWIWVQYSDHIKSLNIVGAHLTSSQLQTWNFGTLDQRLLPSTWSVLFFRTVPDLLGTTSILLLPLLALCFARRRALAAFVCVCGFLVAFLIFTNLHVIHPYYAYANGAFLVAAVAWSIVGLLEGNQWQRFAGLGVFLICLASSISGYYNGYYSNQIQDPPYLASIGNKITSLTDSTDVIVVLGHDWSSEIPYYARRRALMWPSWLGEDFNGPNMKAALGNLAGHRVGALVVRRSTTDPGFVENARNGLGLATEPAYDDSAWTIYTSRLLSATNEASKAGDQNSAVNPLTPSTIGPGGATITASPNPVAAGNGFGTTTVTWDTGDQSWGKVYVAVNDGSEQLFMQGAKGSAKAPWIGADSTYEFRLYKNENNRPLAVVKVTRSSP